MAIIVACHVEPVAESGAASVVVTCQRVVELHRIHRRKWSRIMAITATCHVELVAESGGAVQNPSQEVEQSRGHYCGLPRGAGCREWWSHVESIAEGGAESWPLLWPVRESRPVGRSSIEAPDGER